MTEFIVKLLLWILRLLSLPVMADRSLEGWPTAPEITVAMSMLPMLGKAPRAKGARMGFDNTGKASRVKFPARFSQQAK